MHKALSSNLFLVMLALVGLGIVQVYSSSYIFAFENYGDGLFFLKRQVAFSLIGICAFTFAFIIPLPAIEKYGWILWLVATVGIVLSFVPGVGIKVGGASRWIQFPFGIRIEPAEILKVASVIFVSTLLFQKNHLLTIRGPITKLVLLITPFCLLLRQPDFGSFVIIILTCLALLFLRGLNWKWFAGFFVGAIPVFYYLVMSVDYRRARVMAFLDPWSDPDRKGFQIIQSMLSFHTGGVTGVGLGNGQGKLFFLPEAHTDFTMAVLGEELGFAGIFLLMLLFAFIVFRIFQLAIVQKNNFLKSVTIGFGLLFGLNFLINACVTLGLVPTKGLTLPFLSYGGSSLVVNMFIFGLLVNIEKNSERVVN